MRRLRLRVGCSHRRKEQLKFAQSLSWRICWCHRRQHKKIRYPAQGNRAEVGNSKSDKNTKEKTMRVMVLVKASKTSEAGEMPSEQLLRDMGNFNEELVKAGIMLAGEGLHPSSKGARIRFSGKDRTLINGPFAETKELVA